MRQVWVVIHDICWRIRWGSSYDIGDKARAAIIGLYRGVDKEGHE